MRYDKDVYFQLHTDGEYNERTGNYDAGTVTEYKRAANVMDTSAQTLQLVYGEIRQGSVTVQIQQSFPPPFDSIRIDDDVYRVDYTRRLRGKQTFICSQVAR